MFAMGSRINRTHKQINEVWEKYCKRLNSPYNISHFLLALPLNFATALCFCISSETGHSGCDAYPERADGFSSWQKGGCGRTIDLRGKMMGMAASKDPPENETFPSMLKGRKVESARIILAFPHTFYVQRSFWFNKGWWSKLRRNFLIMRKITFGVLPTVVLILYWLLLLGMSAMKSKERLWVWNNTSIWLLGTTSKVFFLAALQI